MKNEPVIKAALAAVAALVVLLVAFGVDLTATQQVAIGAFAAAFLGLAAAVRNRVTPV